MRGFKRAIANISYNRPLFISSGLVLTAALLLFSLAILVITNVSRITGAWNEVTTVLLYLDGTLEKSEQEKIVAGLKNWPEVAKTRLIAPEMAIKEFMALSPEAAELASGLPPTIFPPVLELSLKTFPPEEFNSFILQLKSTPGLISLDYGQNILLEVGAVAALLRVITAAAAFFILVLIVFIAAFTIKVALYQRRREIEIEWLVGATPAFIRAPFLWEGALMGLGAGLLATLIWVSFGLLGAPKVEEILANLLPALPINLFYWWLPLALLILAPLLAILGTMRGLGKVWE